MNVMGFYILLGGLNRWFVVDISAIELQTPKYKKVSLWKSHLVQTPGGIRSM